MGRGGKKKGKSDKTEKDDVELDVGSLSVAESQPGTSLSSSSKPPEECKIPEAAVEESKMPRQAPQEEEDDDVGLGLGMKSKKRQRKKKKDVSEKEKGSTPTEHTQGIVTTSPVDVSTASPTQPLAGPVPIVQRAYQPAPQPSPHPAYQPGPQPGPHPANQPGPQRGPHPAYQPGPQPGAHPAYQPGPQPGPHPAYQPGPQRGPHPAYQPGPQPGAHPAYQPGPQPGPHPAYQPGPQRGPHPAYQRGPQPAQHPAYQSAPQPTPQSGGRGRGRGWNPVPQTAPLPQTAPIQQSSTSTSSTSQASPAQSAPRAESGGGRQPEPNVSVSLPARSRPSGVVCRFKIPDRRPGKLVTSQSRLIKVLTNYLEMKIQPLKIHRYDVAIKPERPKKLLPKAFAAAKAQNFSKHIIAYDQRKNCYSVTPLWSHPNDRSNYNVEIIDDNGEKVKFEIIIIFTGIVDTGTIINHMQNGGSSLNPPMEAIQCIDVILQQGTLESYVRAGRQYFKRPRNPIDLSSGLEIWTGLFQSAIFTSRAFINIDVAHKGFPKHQSLLDAVVRDFRLDPTKPLDKQWGVDNFLHFLKGLRVMANLAGGNKKREYICNGMVGSPNRLTFPMQDAAGKTKNITVDKYFEEKNCRLRYPNLNCLWVGPRDKQIYYPIELLEVSYGQALNKQLNENQLRTMVREAATPPSDRMNKIKEVISNMNYSANPCFKNFKMQVSNEFLRVDAKVLPPPRLDIGAGRPVDPRKGVWQANRFLKAGALTSWGLIAIEVDTRRVDCQRIIDMMMRTGGSLGMAVSQPKLTNFAVRMTDMHRVLTTAYEKAINMLIVIIPGRFKDAYDKIKRTAELDVGIITQCIKENTATSRMNDQTIRNILLKVNSKLMGINQALEPQSIPQCIKAGGVMVVGADVTHPSPDQSNIPSIAAVTASIDPKCFIYNIELSIQTPKHEIIVEFEDMMFDHLQLYKSRQNALPKKIFVFRDGVSEGQFAQVMNSELVAVHRAYSRLEQRFKPEILFLLVQKRHHTRFFLGDNNPQNVEPGTVVDTDIVHCRELDFYLVSHQAIKGTARPTRYHVVCNDGNIPGDEVEQLAYYLCHLYARCTRSVSYPAPTYYAHLACLRARALTSEKRFNNADLEKKPQRLRVLDRMLQNSRMFFV